LMEEAIAQRAVVRWRVTTWTREGDGNVTVSRMVVSTMCAYTYKGGLHACRRARSSSKRAMAVEAKEEKDAIM
jgi:hypothetical protein